MTNRQAARLVAEERDPREGWRECLRGYGLTLLNTYPSFEYWGLGLSAFSQRGWSIDLYPDKWVLTPDFAQQGTLVEGLEAVILAMLIQGEAGR